MLIVANTDQAVDAAEVALWAELLARDRARGMCEGMEGVVGREVGDVARAKLKEEAWVDEGCPWA